MSEGKQFFRRLTEKAELYGEALPGIPLVELSWDNRVLIECHCGVMEYGCERITVRVKQGHIQIHGQNLKLAVMSRHCLVISGKIDGVSLCRKDRQEC